MGNIFQSVLNYGGIYEFLYQELVNVYSKHTDVEYAEWSKKYLRNQFEFLGIRSPIRRTLTKQFLKEHGLPTESNRKDIILMLWDRPRKGIPKGSP